MRGAEEEQKRKTERTKQLRQSGWVRYGEIDVLSLHLQPQKCQVCGELRWSESSSASLQPRLKHTHTEFNTRTRTHETHTSLRLIEQCVRVERQAEKQVVFFKITLFKLLIFLLIRLN